MKKVIELNQAGIDRLKVIVKELREKKTSLHCLLWSCYTTGKESVIKNPCTICQMLFPRISRLNGEIKSCPYNTYKSSYLIKRLNEIIRYNKKNWRKQKMYIVAVKEKSAGNETVGDKWLETKIFDENTPINEIIKWSQNGLMKPACDGRLIITVPDNPDNKNET